MKLDGNSWLVESLTTPDMAVIHTTKVEDKEVLIVISSYLDISHDKVNYVEKVVVYAAACKQWGIMIGMDSNCHSVIYGL